MCLCVEFFMLRVLRSTVNLLKGLNKYLLVKGKQRSVVLSTENQGKKNLRWFVTFFLPQKEEALANFLTIANNHRSIQVKINYEDWRIDKGLRSATTCLHAWICPSLIIKWVICLLNYIPWLWWLMLVCTCFALRYAHRSVQTDRAPTEDLLGKKTVALHINTARGQLEPQEVKKRRRGEEEEEEKGTMNKSTAVPGSFCVGAVITWTCRNEQTGYLYSTVTHSCYTQAACWVPSGWESEETYCIWCFSLASDISKPALMAGRMSPSLSPKRQKHENKQINKGNSWIMKE